MLRMEEGRSSNRVADFLARSKRGLFGSLLVSQREEHASTFRSVAAATIRWAQMISFLLSPYAFQSWRFSTMNIVRFVLGLPTIHNFWQFFSSQTWLTLYYGALVWITGFLLLTVYCSWSLTAKANSGSITIWPFQALRAIGQFSATVAFIPLLSMLLTNFQCAMPEINAQIQATGLYQCYMGGHLAQSVLSGILAVAFVALCSIFSLVFYESNPFSSNVTAKAHGRVDMVFLALKVVLVLTIDIFPTRLPVWLLVTLCVLSGILWTASVLYFLPYYDARWNAFTAAQATMFLYGSVCLAISEGYHGTDAAVMLYLGLPLAGLAGAYAVRVREEQILHSKLDLLANPFSIEIKARLMLHQVLFGHHSVKLDSNKRQTAGGDSSGGLPSDMGGYEADGDGTDEKALLLDPAVRERPAVAAVLAEILATYKQALQRFSKSAMLSVFLSRFYALLGNRHMEMSMLLQAEKREPALDVAFLVYKARQQADGHGGVSELSALDRVEFEVRLAKARKYTRLAAYKQQLFWAELLDTQPDLSRLHVLSTQMGQASESAEKEFAAIWKLNNQSVQALRLYSAFQEYARADQDKAASYSADADRIEEQKSKEHRSDGGGAKGALTLMQETSVDVMADSTAIITISASNKGQHLGRIVKSNSGESGLNAAACRLFGFPRVQLERKSLFELLPEPLSTLWYHMLEKYVRTGEGKISSTYVAFGLNKTLNIFPMLMCVRERPADRGEPAFICLIRELVRPDEQYLLLTQDQIITAASAGACLDMGIAPQALLNNEVAITDFIAEFNDTARQSEMRSSSKGTYLTINGTMARSELGAKVFADDETPALPELSPRTIAMRGDSLADPTARHSVTCKNATLQTVSLLPPAEERFGATSATPARPGMSNRQGQRPTYGVKQRSVQGAESDDSGSVGVGRSGGGAPSGWKGGRGSAPADVHSIAFSADEAASHQYFYLLTYTRVDKSDTIALAKAGRVRRESIAGMGGRSSVFANSMMRGTGVGGMGSKRLTVKGSKKKLLAASMQSTAAQENVWSAGGPADSVLIPSALAAPGSFVQTTSTSVLTKGGGNRHQLPNAVNQDDEDSSSISDSENDASSGPDVPVAQAGSKNDSTALQAVTGTQVDGDGSDVDSVRAIEDRAAAVPAIPVTPAPMQSPPVLFTGRSIAESVKADGGQGTASISVSAAGELGVPRSALKRKSVTLAPVPEPDPASARPAGGSTSRAAEGGDVEEGGSHSKGDNRSGTDKDSSQGSSTTYGKRIIGRLRRVLEENNSHLSRGLVALRAAGLFVMALSIALAVLSAVVLDGQFAAYRQNLQYTDMGATRIIAMFTSVRHVQNLVLHARGWARDNSAEGIAAEKAALLASTDTFVQAHRSMYSMLQATRKANLYMDPVQHPVYLTEYDTPEAMASPFGSVRRVNLFQAGLAMAQAFQAVADAPLVNLSRVDYPPVLFSLVNGLPGGIAHERLHQSSLETGYDMSVETKLEVENRALFVYIFVSSVLAAVGLVVFAPILLTIERSKDAIVKRFVFLPRLIREALHQQSERRMAALREHMNDDDDEGMDVEDMIVAEDGEEERKEAGAGGDRGAAAGIWDGQGQDEDEDENSWAKWDSIMAQLTAQESAKANAKLKKQASASAVSAAAGSGARSSTGGGGTDSERRSERKSRRQAPPPPRTLAGWLTRLAMRGRTAAYKKSLDSILWLFAVYLGPLVVLFLFFTALYIMSSQILATTLALSSAQVSAAYRSACVRESVMDIKGVLMNENDRAYFLVQLAAARDTLDCVRYHNELLAYGLHGEEYRGAYARSTEVIETGSSRLLSEDLDRLVYVVQYEDACTHVPDATAGRVNASLCASWGGGVVRQGLSTLLTEFNRRGRVLLDRRQRARMVQNQLSGYLIPVANYPYANDTCSEEQAGGNEHEHTSCWVYPGVGSTGGANNGSTSLSSPAPDLRVRGDIPSTWDPSAYSAVPWSMAGEMRSEDLMWLVEADELFVTPLLELLQNIYNSQGTQSIDSYRYALSVFVSVFIVFFVTFMVFGFLPQVFKLHGELQKKRSMLLFLPPQVIRAVPDIRALVDEILADDVSGLGRASVRVRAGMAGSMGRPGRPTGGGVSEDEETDGEALSPRYRPAGDKRRP